MKRRKPNYDRENNKCKKKIHFTFNFVIITYFTGTETSSVSFSSVSSRLASVSYTQLTLPTNREV